MTNALIENQFGRRARVCTGQDSDGRNLPLSAGFVDALVQPVMGPDIAVKITRIASFEREKSVLRRDFSRDFDRLGSRRAGRQHQ